MKGRWTWQWTDELEAEAKCFGRKKHHFHGRHLFLLLLLLLPLFLLFPLLFLLLLFPHFLLHRFLAFFLGRKREWSLSWPNISSLRDVVASSLLHSPASRPHPPVFPPHPSASHPHLSHLLAKGSYSSRHPSPMESRSLFLLPSLLLLFLLLHCPHFLFWAPRAAETFDSNFFWLDVF